MRNTVLILTLVLVAYAATGLYFVGPDEMVVVRRCGRMLPAPSGPGAHFGLPWGWDVRDRLRPGEVKRVTLGPLALATTATGSTTRQFLTGDRNLVNVQASVQYSVADPRHYLFQTDALDRILEDSGLAMLAHYVCGTEVDQMLTTGRVQAAVELRDQLQQLADRYQLGVSVRSVDLRAVQPPAAVAPAFNEVVAALREKQQLVNEATSYQRSARARTEAEVQRLRDEAQAYRDRTVRAADGQSQVFLSLLHEYRRAPELTARRLYLDTIAETLPRFRAKLIVGSQEGLDLSIVGESSERDETRNQNDGNGGR